MVLFQFIKEFIKNIALAACPICYQHIKRIYHLKCNLCDEIDVNNPSIGYHLVNSFNKEYIKQIVHEEQQLLIQQQQQEEEALKMNSNSKLLDEDIFCYQCMNQITLITNVTRCIKCLYYWHKSCCKVKTDTFICNDCNVKGAPQEA